MTKRNVAKSRASTKPRTEKPVDSEIRRAAKRAGITERPTMPSPPSEPATAEQVGALADVAVKAIVASDLAQVLADALAVIATAEQSFEHEGDGNVLAEGLRAAAHDFALLGAALSNPVNPDHACFLRAEIRCGLALAIHEFRERHGLRGPLTAKGGAS